MINIFTLSHAMLHPFSTEGKIDPFEFKKIPKWHPYRSIWTLHSRVLERNSRTFPFKFDESALRSSRHRRYDRGESLVDTAVTAHQLELLQLSVLSSANVDGYIVEIGSYRGVTTAHLASETSKTIYAVDPFMGYGGADEDYNIFERNTRNISNINHIRLPSGSAAVDFKGDISLLFIDAVHDFSNSWFDFCAWSPKVAANGFIAMHDVDDFPGVGKTCQLINSLPAYSIWAYAPNIVIFQKS